MAYDLVLQRTTDKKRSSEEVIKKQLDYILGRALGGQRGRGWQARTQAVRSPYQRPKGGWVYTYRLSFEKISGQRGGEAEYKQWENIKAMATQSGVGTKFGSMPWRVVDQKTLSIESPTRQTVDTILTPVTETSEEIVSEVPSKSSDKVGGIRDVSHFDEVKSWSDLHIDPSLLVDDDALANHPSFNEIYGRNAQIRMVLSAIQSGVETEGLRRPHGVLWGHAACGKTSILLAVEKMLGAGAVLRLDATSTTRAGLEKMFFTDLPKVPPIVVMEEAEKASEDALKLWLGALDDRGEIRKVNFRVSQVREIRVLFFCTVNNKTLFDRMMGSDGKTQGALSSRCVTDIYCPRPDEEVLRMILKRDIQKYGGEEAWVEPCLQLARDLKIDDPRKVLAFLAGGNRLLTGEYQADRLKIHHAAMEFEKNV